MTSAAAYNAQPRRPDWGVRVDPRKRASMTEPIGIAPLPAEISLPLRLDGLQRAMPLVEAGQSVLCGQPVARLLGSGENCLCAPLAGRVSLQGPAEAPATLRIAATGDDHWHPDCQPPAAPESLSRAALCELIGRAGIVGLGGALFPTATKLGSESAVGLLILNGAECEPYITCDEMLLRERPEPVIHGARIMLRALGAEKAVIAVESDMPEARIALKAALEKCGDDRIGVAEVTAKYPAGGERQLVELLTGKEVPLGGHPDDIGVVCQNVATAAAISDLFRTGRPLVSRIVTVTGEGVVRPRNWEVRLGTRVAELIQAAGGYARDDCELVMGGPMMGRALANDQEPVTEATNCIIVAAPGELSAPQPEFPCIRCGECSRVCPARLMPQDLLLACDAADRESLAALNVEACIECGCCDYVCPSHIALTARFVSARRAQRAWRTERRRAEELRERSEAHSRRLARRRQDFADGPGDDPDEAARAMEAMRERLAGPGPDRDDG